jgi:radical SAM protein with 4Fe4S-binding SPASM domain
VERGVKVFFANVLMRDNFQDYSGVQALAAEVGAKYTVDPTITPMMDGDRSILNLNIERAELEQVFRDASLLGTSVEEFCAPPAGPLTQEDAMETLPCSASHTFCYVSPYGDVYPCVQFPLPTGNVRTTRFIDIWKHSPQMNEVRSITMNDLPVCSTCSHGGGSCTRCPGLAYMEGNMRGPSSQDCEKSYARTGMVTAGMLAHHTAKANAGLVQIKGSTEQHYRPQGQVELNPERNAEPLGGIAHPPQQLAHDVCSIGTFETFRMPWEASPPTSSSASQKATAGSTS